MGLFDSPLDKAKQQNVANQSEMKRILNNIYTTCTDTVLANLARSAYDDLASQAPSFDTALYDEIDASLIKQLQGIEKDNSSGNYALVRRHLPKAIALIRQRKLRCVDINALPPDERKAQKAAAKMNAKKDKAREKAIRQGKIAPDAIDEAEEITNILYNLQFEKDQLIEEIKVLQEMGDEVSLSLIKSIKYQIKGINENLITYSNDRNQEILISALRRTNAEKRRALSKRGNAISNSDILNDLNKEFEELKAKEMKNLEAENEAAKSFMKSKQAQQSSNSFLDDDLSAGLSTDEDEDFSAGLDIGHANVSSAKTHANTSAGKSSSAEDSMNFVVSNIESVIGKLNTSIGILQTEIEDYNDKIEDVEDDLRDLIKRRKSLSVTGSIPVDSEIDEKAEERKQLVRERDMYISAKETLKKRLSVAKAIGAQKKIDRVFSIVDKINGEQIDYAEWAMFINERVDKLNQDHMDADTIVSVATGTEIEKNPTYTSATINNLVGEKDEHKYDSLEAELGKR